MTSKSKTSKNKTTYCITWCIGYNDAPRESFVESYHGRERAARWFKRWHRTAIILSVRVAK